MSISAVAFGEFCAESPHCDWNITGPFETLNPPNRLEDRHQFLNQNLGQGPTIIYVPTRKETLNISKFLCGCGVKAAAYNAKVCVRYNSILDYMDGVIRMSCDNRICDLHITY